MNYQAISKKIKSIEDVTGITNPTNGHPDA